MIETAFLGMIGDYLKTKANLSPAPATVGIAEPAAPGDMPAIILGLKHTKRLGNGLGNRSSLITGGALAWAASIDLANPVLPAEPTFRLLSADRKNLILPHGGLVRSDGTTGPLSPADLSVKLNTVSQTVVTAAPAVGQVQADPVVGTLTFGTALPSAGNVAANYFLGQWEQRTQRMAGTLRVAIESADTAAVQGISEGVLTSLESPDIPGLREINLIDLGSIGRPDAAFGNARTRVAEFSFEFEMEINQPESSGGIILRIPVNANVSLTA